MQSRSPCGWQEPNYLSHHCCLLGSAQLAGSWSLEPEPGLQTNTPVWNVGILNSKPNACPYLSFKSMSP